MEDERVEMKEEYFEEKVGGVKNENIKGEENVKVKKEDMNLMTELEKVKEENRMLKRENARLRLKLKECESKPKIKHEGVIKIEEGGRGEVGGKDEERRGEDSESVVGEGETEEVQAKPVKRKLRPSVRGKKAKVNYKEDKSDEDVDDPDVAVDDEPNYADRAAKKR